MRVITIICVLLIASCDKQQAATNAVIVSNDSASVYALSAADLADSAGKATGVETGKVKADELVTFARTLKGIPYKYHPRTLRADLTVPGL